MNKDNLYSYHVFLFPFKWEYKKNSDASLEEQMKMNDFVKMLSEPSSKWEDMGSWYPPQSITAYNEVNYFFDFVRGAIYDKNEKESFLKHFKYKIIKPAKYCIKVGSKDYRLDIDDIMLHIYNTGVGVLGYFLNNKEESQSSPEDILAINQFGRRLFPPFYGIDHDLIGTQDFFEDQDWQSGLEKTKEKELANKIWIEQCDMPFVEEHFDFDSIPPKLSKLPRHVKGLFPQSVNDQIKLTNVLDDRMFVLCWYGNNEMAEEVRVQFPLGKNDEVNFEKNKGIEWYYKFLFVDFNFPTCQNNQMAADLLRNHTSLRWKNYNTLYGVSRYSFVMLTGTIEHLKKPDVNAVFLVSHMQTMYYKIAELCLLQRACVLRFSDEVNEISNLKPQQDSAKRVNNLYKRYIRFVNRIYFREITSQEQGIELYDNLQKHMKLNEQVKDLDREIQELHQYVQMEEQQKQNRKLTQLTWVATILLPPTLIAGYMGMNLGNEWKFEGFSWKPYLDFWYLVGISILFTGFVFLCLRFIDWINRNKK